MTDVKPLKLGTKPEWGATQCLFGLPPDPQCGKPGVTHVYFLTSNQVTVTCDEHLQFIAERALEEFDTHARGGDCGMPGALWHFAYEDEDEGYCFFPAPDDASLLVEELEPVVLASRMTRG